MNNEQEKNRKLYEQEQEIKEGSVMYTRRYGISI